jgi:hypothetical protein
LAKFWQHIQQKLQNRRSIRQKRAQDPNFKAADDQRVAVEKAYQHRTFKEKWALTGDYAQSRSYQLKWRLNWALLIVGFLIAAVYIILFFA